MSYKRGDNKRFLSYSSKAKAENAFKNNGFYLSGYTVNYIKDKYPELVTSNYISWSHIESLFIAKEFLVTYQAKE